MHRVYFGTNFWELRTEEEYDAFRKLFTEADAAGGIAVRDDGRFLMIKRNGVWDIPKGHRERGESMEECALREVKEETGLTELELGDLICRTDHCYFRDGKWTLKHTWWYRMKLTGSPLTTPQEEEGISCAEWMDPKGIMALCRRTYASIAAVLKQFYKKSV